MEIGEKCLTACCIAIYFLQKEKKGERGIKFQYQAAQPTWDYRRPKGYFVGGGSLDRFWSTGPTVHPDWQLPATGPDSHCRQFGVHCLHF
jgi:hypothetical protein